MVVGNSATVLVLGVYTNQYRLVLATGVGHVQVVGQAPAELPDGDPMSVGDGAGGVGGGGSVGGEQVGPDQSD